MKLLSAIFLFSLISTSAFAFGANASTRMCGYINIQNGVALMVEDRDDNESVYLIQAETQQQSTQINEASQHNDPVCVRGTMDRTVKSVANSNVDGKIVLDVGSLITLEKR